jgi:hypothetical protein
MGNILDYIHIGNNFMDRTPIAQYLKERIDKCTAKEIVTSLKRAYRVGEIFCQLFI